MSTKSPTVSGARTAPAEAAFAPERHVYEPHRVGLPPLRFYIREAWRRRHFAREMSRTQLRAQHFNTALGQLWLVINPLLLTLVYFVLVDILRNGTRGTEYFAHLMVGLFAYHYFSQSVQHGTKSVVGGGRLILNTAFPRVLLPLSSVITGFWRFLPTMAIYAIVHLVAGLPIGPALLWAIPIFALLTVFTAGVTMLLSALQVYFRDVKSFLPYALRIWMYGSPVLYYLHEVPDKFQWLMTINPMAPILGAWSQAINEAQTPDTDLLLGSLAWAVAALVIGGLFFIAREREFAVRL
ncbi:MAG TPA: ABC transporter permease [Solirubrobacter sp.]|nr:ABC transporter permease [Solirubrobacter sp.]